MRSKVFQPAMLLAIVAGMSPLLFATTHATVGLCAGPGTHYSHIQDAVNAVASSPGAIVGVCPGPYPEQVKITSSLTLQGINTGTQDAAVILPPSGGVVVNTTDQQGNVAAQVLVQNTSGVTIANLTVDGTGNQYTSDDLRGILYQDASGTVDHVAVRNQVPNDTPTGDQSGQGIMVETTNTSSAVLTVENSSVHNYNKNGIVGRYAGSSLTAIGNYVQGSGPISYIAQNGIELAYNGAFGVIKNNTVIDNFYIPTSSSSSDILLYDSAKDSSVTVNGNIVGNSNIPIALETASPGTYGDGVYVENNKVFGTSPLDGIDLCTNGNVVTGNIIFNSAQSGIHLDASCGNAVSGNNVSKNTMLESACAGILIDSGAGSNTTSPNTFFTVPYPVTSSTGSCTIPAPAARAKGRAKFVP